MTDLFNHIPTELTSFKDICEAMGLAKPTQELRAHMKELIASGAVVQEGQRRGAKYRRAEGAEAPPEPKAEAEASEEAPSAALEVLPMTSAPKAPPKVEWVWEDPQSFVWTKEPRDETDLHRWLLENWEDLAAIPTDLIRLSIRISERNDCSASPVKVGNALCDLAQRGQIRVKRKVGTNGYRTDHLYGAWTHEPELGTD